MRKYYSTVFTVLFILVSSVSPAQERPRFEMGVSGGGPGLMFGAIGGAATYFSLIGEMKYTPEKWISIGLMGGIHDHHPGSDMCYSKEQISEASTTYECNLMLTLYANWITREKIKIYSGIGYGTMGGYVYADGRPAHGFQITPIGVSFGKRLFGFAELGTGWMFFPARAGIGYRF